MGDGGGGGGFASNQILFGHIFKVIVMNYIGYKLTNVIVILGHMMIWSVWT